MYSRHILSLSLSKFNTKEFLRHLKKSTSGMGLWTRRSEFGDKVGILGLRRVAAVPTAEVTCSALRERHPVSRAPAPPSSPTPPRGMALAVPPKTAAYQLFWREEAAVGGRRLQGGAGWRERERKKKKKRTKKKETLIRMKEKGGGGGAVLYLNMHADKGLIKQHTYSSHATDFSICTTVQENTSVNTSVHQRERKSRLRDVFWCLASF